MMTMLKQVIPLLAALAVAACAQSPEPSSSEAIGIANPASVHCRDEGGRTDIRRDAQGGQYGVCVFEDGRQCEEWALFRDKRCVAPKSAE